MHIPLALAAVAVLFAAASAAAATATATDDDFRDGDFVSDPSSASQSIEGVIETTCSADTFGDIFLPK